MVSEYGFNLKSTGKRVIDDDESSRFGVYVWEMPDGSIVSDDERRFLSIAAEQGDLHKINKLMYAVKEFGITEGKAKFLAGHSKVSDEEYEEQLERFKDGGIADPLDVGAYKDELRGRKKNGR